MPPLTLRIVAGLLVAVAVLAFGAGVWNAPQRGRMPGERAAGPAGAAPIAAADAVAIGQDRIEGLAPRELTAEEKEKAQADKEAREEAADAARAAAATTPEQAQAAAAPAKPVIVTGGQAEPPPPPPQPAPDEAPH
jgi:hypothetical protein